LSNNGFVIRTSEGELFPENFSFYKLLEYPKLGEWAVNTLLYAFNDRNHLLSLLETGIDINARDS